MDRERNQVQTRRNSPHSREQFFTGVVLNRRRRYALYHLYESSGPVALEDLARQVAAWERVTTPEEVACEYAESVRSSLRRTHLPYLAESGFVAYDDCRDVVAGRVEDPEVAVFLANDPRTTVTWYRVYLALTAVSAVLLGLVWLDMPPFDRISPIVAAALVVGLFTIASLAYWYDVYRWRRQTEDRPPDFLVTLEEDVPLEAGENEMENEAENETETESQTKSKNETETEGEGDLGSGDDSGQ